MTPILFQLVVNPEDFCQIAACKVSRPSKNRGHVATASRHDEEIKGARKDVWPISRGVQRGSDGSCHTQGWNGNSLIRGDPMPSNERQGKHTVWIFPIQRGKHICRCRLKGSLRNPLNSESCLGPSLGGGDVQAVTSSFRKNAGSPEIDALPSDRCRGDPGAMAFQWHASRAMRSTRYPCDRMKLMSSRPKVRTCTMGRLSWILISLPSSDWA